MTPYEVTYRNLFPSDGLNARVKTGFLGLSARAPGVSDCHVIFDRKPHGAMQVRVQVKAHGVPCVVERHVPRAFDLDAVIEALDSGFEHISAFVAPAHALGQGHRNAAAA